MRRTRAAPLLAWSRTEKAYSKGKRKGAGLNTSRLFSKSVGRTYFFAAFLAGFFAAGFFAATFLAQQHFFAGAAFFAATFFTATFLAGAFLAGAFLAATFLVAISFDPFL